MKPRENKICGHFIVVNVIVVVNLLWKCFFLNNIRDKKLVGMGEEGGINL